MAPLRLRLWPLSAQEPSLPGQVSWPSRAVVVDSLPRHVLREPAEGSQRRILLPAHRVLGTQLALERDWIPLSTDLEGKGI